MFNYLSLGVIIKISWPNILLYYLMYTIDHYIIIYNIFSYSMAV